MTQPVGANTFHQQQLSPPPNESNKEKTANSEKNPLSVYFGAALEDRPAALTPLIDLFSYRIISGWAAINLKYPSFYLELVDDKKKIYEIHRDFSELLERLKKGVKLKKSFDLNEEVGVFLLTSTKPIEEFVEAFIKHQKLATSETLTLVLKKGNVLLDEVVRNDAHDQVLASFFQALQNFKETGESSALITLLSRTKSFEEDKKEKDPFLEACREACITWIPLLKIKNADIFEQSMISFSDPIPSDISQKDLYRTSVRLCYTLAQSIEKLSYLLSAEKAKSTRGETDLAAKIPRAESGYELHMTIPDPSFTAEQLQDILLADSHLRKKFQEEKKHFEEMRESIFQDFFSTYFPVLFSPRASAIFSSDPPYGLRYVEENREIYENFLPRVREFYTWAQSICKAQEKRALLLKNFSLWMEFGDHSSFKNKLKSVRGYQKDVENILLEEIQLFAERSKKAEFALPIIKSLQSQENKFHKYYYNLYQLECEFYSQSHFLCKAVLEGKIDYMDSEYSLFPSLFQQSPILSSLNPSRPEITTAQILPSPETEETEVEAVRSPTPPKEPSCEELFNKFQRDMSALALTMNKGCLKEPAKHALQNAHIHEQNFLRLIYRSMLPMSDQQLLPFIADTVRHGTLSIEQLLSALACKSHRVTNATERAQFLSHDLVYLLNRSVFQQPLPHHLREWIQEMNGGELYCRNVTRCDILDNFAGKLLAKAYLLARGNTTFTREGHGQGHAQGVWEDFKKYLREFGPLYMELQRRIDPSINVEECKKTYAKICRQVGKNTAALKQEEESSETKESFPLYSLLDLIEKDTATLSIDTRSRIANLRYNLLPQLEREMNFSHPSLTPQGAHLHASNVLLLTQQIGEEFLFCLVNKKTAKLGAKSVFPAEIDHDLGKLIFALDINREETFNAKQNAFLDRGKEIRLLTRYFADYEAIYKKQKQHLPGMEEIYEAVKGALSLSGRQEFHQKETLEEGYISGNKNVQKKVDRIKNVVNQEIDLLITILRRAHPWHNQ